MVRLPPRAWKQPSQTGDERARELAADERDMTRALRRLFLQTVLGCVLCCALGLFLVAWALHTTDPGWGAIAFWSGLLIGDVGMLVLLLRHYRRITERGF
jgi:hypothetical protein